MRNTHARVFAARVVVRDSAASALSGEAKVHAPVMRDACTDERKTRAELLIATRQPRSAELRMGATEPGANLLHSIAFVAADESVLGGAIGIHGERFAVVA